MFETWIEAAEYCADVYGIYVDLEDRYFHCPFCDEPLYESDWLSHRWDICPVCEGFFEEEVVENAW